MSVVNEVSKYDNVNNPKHYCGHVSVECIEVMRVTYGEVAVYNFCLANAFKYLWRYKDKNGEEDIKKAKWYLDYAESLILEEYSIISTELQEMYKRTNALYYRIVNG